MRPPPVGRGMGRRGDPDAAVSSVWTAVAAARLWAAAAHGLAAWESYRDGWHAMAEAATAIRNAAAAGAEAVGKDGRINHTARGNAVDALKGAVRAKSSARALFSRTASRAGLTASWQVRAAKALAMACDADNERAIRGQAVQARRLVRVADGWAARAASNEKTVREAVHRWEAGAAGAGARPVDRAVWVGKQASIRADAEYDRAKWQDMAQKADIAVRVAGDDLEQCVDAAERAGAAVEKLGRLPPEAEEGVAAWKKAVETAARVAGECGPHAKTGGRSRTGRPPVAGRRNRTA